MVSFSQLKRLENLVIQAIRTEGPFGRLTSLSGAAKQAQITPASKTPIDVHLSFTLPTRLREDAGRHAVERPFHVGCYAVPAEGRDEIAQLSYSVLIGQDASPSMSVARKFHFDFEPMQFRNVLESKPTYHLQMCGELSEYHEMAGYTEDHIAHLLPSWSQPRVPSQPMSLALVLNWLFIEFGAEVAVRNARLNPRWRSLVRAAEREILKPYYDACSAFLSTTANEDESFMAKHIYEER
ncbi:hypothetical protein [Burkholderia cenocepacia]|uniref:hypothetical protein n=1 Tax=Burkholderia cenocepacia TaxID=95486 RepID=UPI00117849C0|nr:hypothetical protein [Burkholderia cenocepacia]MBR8078986.1 hypothetical protein [Burkholderia cenocepacia]